MSNANTTKYTGNNKKRTQAQRQVILTRIIKYLHAIENTEHAQQILHFCIQTLNIESGKASTAERCRHQIHLWTDYHEDIEELTMMKELVVQVATMKARKAQRAARAAQTP